MEIKHVLAVITLMLFVANFLLSKSPRRAYLLAIVYLFPFMDLNVTNSDYGNITVFDTLTYFIFFFLIKEFIRTRYNSTNIILFLLLLSILTLGSFRSDFLENSLYNLVKFISPFIFVKLLLDECFDDSIFIEQVIKGLKFISILAICFAVIQMFVGLQFTFYNDLNQNVFDSNIERLPGFFQDPQVFAQFLSMTCFLCFVRNEKDKIQTINFALFILLFLVLLLSGGRSAFVGFCVGISFVILFIRSRYRGVLILSCLVGYLFILNYPEYFSLLNRQEGLHDAFEVRHKIWNEALSVFHQHPLLGIGIGNYINYTALYSLDGYYIINDQIVYYGTENGYLKILAETGIMGFISVIIFIIKPVFNSLTEIRKTSDGWNLYFLIAAVASWFVSFNSLYTLSDKRIVILLAIILSYMVYLRRKHSTSYGF